MKIKFIKAHNGDSIIISFKDTNEKNRNILIDGGMPKTYYGSGKYGDLYDTIEQIKIKEEKIDLLILTHIDEDHIGGLKKWFEKDKDAFEIIEKVWFNSGRSIAKYFDEEENKELIETLKIFETTQTSVPQAIVFEDYIEKFNVWDKEILKTGQTVNQNGVEIKLLSPNDKALKRLLKEYKKPKHNYQTSGASTDWNTSISDFIKEENNPNYKLEEDGSVPNGSSIAFILTFESKNYLFLGDAHPSIIIDSLKDLGYTKENPIKLEFLKVSHHGSCKNTNQELLELIKADNYVISSNSEVHGLPNKRTIARLINHNSNSNIHFNYDSVRQNIFNEKDFEDFEGFKINTIDEWE
ncbi:ComEC/Rec2 family competence protein [Formosa undariae]|uniref:ComEC/Rec2 family competence protein n=1 Tax=Formosa undariae TaxID=1325436 RepID=A0ABV5EYT6_9FLAO